MNRIFRRLCILTTTLTALVGCGDHGKDTESTTHDATHSGGSTGADTSTSAATTTATTTAGTTTAGTTTAVEPPAAPTDLAASILEGGVHLTWKDASDNEDNFILENKAAGEADFSMVIELPFDSVTYHDIDVMAATEYTYRVKAINAGGEAVSNEAVIQVP